MPLQPQLLERRCRVLVGMVRDEVYDVYESSSECRMQVSHGQGGVGSEIT